MLLVDLNYDDTTFYKRDRFLVNLPVNPDLKQNIIQLVCIG